MKPPVVHYVTIADRYPGWSLRRIACEDLLIPMCATTENPNEVTCKRCRRTKVFTERDKP